MLGNILTRTCNRRQWLLRCPECGNEWVSDVHRDEYYGWDVEQEYCPECDEPGVVIDDEVGRDDAMDEAYDRRVEERMEKLMERREIDA
jgi:NAD-dependent SIR2 family protein deacetylase